VLLETGLQLGEALPLKWTDIELDAANEKKLSGQQLSFPRNSGRQTMKVFKGTAMDAGARPL
jgi:hypothetical protein